MTAQSRQQNVAVCVATYLRKDLLRNCLHAIGNLLIPDACQVNGIIVDNDFTGSAATIYHEFKMKLPVPLYYCIEPSRGISAARNRLVKEAVDTGSDWIAFIDDDEMPDKAWLLNLFNALVEHEADVAAGPVIQTAGTTPPDTFTVGSSRPTGSEPRYIAAGNVIFSSRLIHEQGLQFDRFYDFIGGEDFDFFHRSKQFGNKHIWVADACVFETVSRERQGRHYMFYRHFTGGINSVLRYKRTHYTLLAWLHYLPKAVGKFIDSCFCFIKSVIFARHLNFRKGVKKLASGLGYLSGLCGFIIERYR